MTDATYTFQIPVNYLIVVQVVETTDNPDQLRTGEWEIRLSANQTCQFQAIDPWMIGHIVQHIPIYHPLGHHAKIE